MSNGVDFRKTALDLRAQLDAAMGREAALREELDQCGSMAEMIENKEWAEHAGTGQVSSRVESAFTQLHNELAESQQRLTVAERALKFYADGDHYSTDDGLNWDSCSGEPSNILWHEEQPWFIEDGSVARAALNPAEENTVSCKFDWVKR